MENQLIKLCKKQQGSAQKALYDRYADTMFRICFRYVKNEHDAEDILINGFMKVFQNIEKFEPRGKGSLEGWIKRIMINESLMHLRKNTNFNLVSEANCKEIDADISLESNIAAEEIYKLIRRLPLGYRTVFNLFAIEGYSHKEIAEQLNITESTSKTQLRKARITLQKLLVENEMHYEVRRSG